MYLTLSKLKCIFYKGHIKPAITFVLALSVFLLYFLTRAAEKQNLPDVVVLTEETFDTLVMDSEDVWLVEFYAPWCPHCKKFADEYVSVGRKLKGWARVGTVDTDKCKSLKSQFAIRSFPTFLIFGYDKKTPVHFQGSRDVKNLVEAALAVAAEVK